MLKFFKMLVKLSDVQKKLIDKIAKENGFSSYTMATNPGSEKGDNFLGILTTVTLEDVEKNKLELILKAAHQNENFRRAVPLRDNYSREIYLYENIFDELKAYQEKHNVSEPFNAYVKMYGGTMEEGNECFVMENIKTDGYQLWNRKIPMNSGHLTAVIKQYAKLHGTCLAMNHKNPKLYKKLTKDAADSIWEKDDVVSKENLKTYIKNVMTLGYTAVEDDPELTRILKCMEPQVENVFFKKFRDPENKQVLIHGDCWCNNFMFKYENDQVKTKPLNVKLIDWQMSHLSSPAYDFCYFLLVNSSIETLENYETYLKIFYDTLSEHISKFDCDPGEVYPFSRLQKYLQPYMVYGLFSSMMTLKLMLSDSHEVPNFVEVCGNGNFLDGMDFKFQNFDACQKRVKDLIRFVNSLNFI